MDPADFSGLGAGATKSLAARADADAMAELVTAEIAERVWPQHTRDPDFLEALRLSVRDNVRAIVALFTGELTIEDANPEGAFGFADLTAELGIPVSELENAYWWESRPSGGRGSSRPTRKRSAGAGSTS